MAVVYGRDTGLDATLLIVAILMIQIVAFPFTLLYGRLAERTSTRTMLMVGIGVYALIVLLAFAIPVLPAGPLQSGAFWLTALLVASSQGGIQALSRSWFSRLIPAEEAARFYVSLLDDSHVENVVRPWPDGPALVVEFTLAGAPCMTMSGNPDVQPSHMASLSVRTVDQAETDRLWDALCADGGEPGLCGWLQDRFGVHWQIVPEALPRLMAGDDPARASRVQAALREMRKIDVAGLEAAAGP